MDDFKKLLELIGDNQKAKALVEAISSKYNEVTIRAESLSSQFEDAKKERDNYKKGNKLVKKLLGVDRINEDVLKEKLDDLMKDNESAQKLQELAMQLQAKDEEIANTEKEYEQKMTSYEINQELSKAFDSNSGLIVDDPLLRDALKNIIAPNIQKIGDQIVPITKIGDQIVPMQKDGKTLSPSEYIRQTLADEKFAGFVKPTVRAGGGNIEQGGGASTRKEHDNIMDVPAEQLLD